MSHVCHLLLFALHAGLAMGIKHHAQVMLHEQHKS